ncbi:Hypothetical predicted protein [Octopus vulgaris]|uniref:Uncharacterized protein n=1 Tax=Octopus vulgaris TaxID=6645 RepID=A0AA36EZH7_OCTVU|nr:Hypothetical predicted protein [Octopus vulgaris]
MPKLCRYDYHQANWETINNQLQIIDWDLYLTGPDKHKKFLNKIEEICEKNVPLKKTKSTKKPVPRERKILMRKRSRLRNKTSKLTSKHELQKVLDQIYRLEDNLKQHYDEECNNAEKKAIENIKKNPKCFYSFAKKYSNTKSTIGPLQRQNGDVVNNPIEMAEMLGQQYESVFSEPSKTMKIHDPGKFFKDIDHTKPTLSDIDFNPEDIARAIDKLSMHSAAGPDDFFIKNTIIKETKQSKWQKEKLET